MLTTNVSQYGPNILFKNRWVMGGLTLFNNFTPKFLYDFAHIVIVTLWHCELYLKIIIIKTFAKSVVKVIFLLKR